MTRISAHEALRRIGDARLFYKLPDGQGTPEDTWFELGLVENARVRLDQSMIDDRGRYKGVSRITQQRLNEQSAEMTFDLSEVLFPPPFKYLLDPGGTPSHTPATIAEYKDSFMLFADRLHELRHPHDIKSALPVPEGTPFATTDAGGAFAASNYSFAIVAWATADESNLANASYPAAGDPDCVQDNLAVALNERVLLDWDPPTGFTPDHYSVYLQDAAAWDPTNLGIKVAEVGGASTSTIVNSEASIGDDQTFTGVAPTLFELRDFNTGAAFTINVDYVFDAVNGTVKRVVGGGIDNGETVVAEYRAAVPPHVTTNIGAGKAIPTYLEIMLLQLDVQQGGTVEEGVEFYFHRVNPQSGGFEIPFSDSEFGVGMSATMNLHFDASQGRIGYMTQKSPMFDGVVTAEY